MNEKLDSMLIEYKNKTLEIIENVKTEKFDLIEKNFYERQQIIQKINSINYSKEEFLLISEELDLLKVEEKINKIMNEKRDKLKAEIESFLKVKNANSSYKKSSYVDSIFLNKKI